MRRAGLLGARGVPAGLAFGAIYQNRGGGQALTASAIGMAVATVAWLAVTGRITGQEVR